MRDRSEETGWCDRLRWSGLAALLGIVACVTPSQLDEEVQRLRQEIDTARRDNQALRMIVEDLVPLKEDAAEAAKVREAIAERVANVEKDRERIARLEESLDALERRLAAQQGRLASLAQELDAIRRAPPMERLAALEKALADLEGRVATTDRLSEANRAAIERLTERADRHEAEFERQMRLLGEYVRQQFVPLAEGLVAYLYEESRRMSENAQRLEEFARRVDPYKFEHLRPGYAPKGDEKKAPPPDDDDG